MTNDIILKVENVSKQYRLGVLGTGTISHDLIRWWSKIRGKGDPYLKVGEINDRATKGSSDYVWALRDISFDVREGEVLGIIGKNGAGKSTLLKILSQVTGPTTGSIKSKGRIASLLEVGTGFHPEMTGKENIFLNGAILGMTKKEIASKLDEIVNFSGCERYIDTPVKRYSSGMKVRLAFAVAAHLEPDILIVDEVLAVGDAEFQKKAIGKMQDISKSDGRTVLFVSHNMAAVRNLCSRGLLIENGKIVLDSDTNEVIKKYLTNESLNISKKISERKDRIGTGHARLKDVTIETTSIGVGEEFIIKIDYENISSFKVKEFGVSIWKKDETKVISLNTFLKGEINRFDDKGTVYCKIDSLPLIEGEYILNAFVTTEDSLADYIEKVKTFKVVDTDYFGTGKTIDPNWGLIAVNHNWYTK